MRSRLPLSAAKTGRKIRNTSQKSPLEKIIGAAFDALDIAGFAKKTFGMFAGEETTVVLQCDASLTGVMIDRFGLDVPMRPDGEDQIRVRANVAVSRQFFGWLTGLGGGVQIISPAEIRTQYQQYLTQILDRIGHNEEEIP